jgi:hypothetical protein
MTGCVAGNDTFWYLDGKIHRTDGPAVEWADGDKSWFLNGVSLSLNEWLDQNTDMTEEEKVMFKLQYG